MWSVVTGQAGCHPPERGLGAGDQEQVAWACTAGAAQWEFYRVLAGCTDICRGSGGLLGMLRQLGGLPRKSRVPVWVGGLCWRQEVFRAVVFVVNEPGKGSSFQAKAAKLLRDLAFWVDDWSRAPLDALISTLLTFFYPMHCHCLLLRKFSIMLNL